MRLKPFLYTIAFFTSMTLSAQIEEAKLDQLVENTLKTFNVPGISVGVIKDGKVVYAKGHGVRAMSNKKEMDNSTLVGVASNISNDCRSR